jgi:hypothetical protein
MSVYSAWSALRSVQPPELVELGGFRDDRNPSTFGSQADTLAGENFLQPAAAKIVAPPRSKFLGLHFFGSPRRQVRWLLAPEDAIESSGGPWLRIRSRFQQIHWARYNAQGWALAVTHRYEVKPCFKHAGRF